MKKTTTLMFAGMLFLFSMGCGSSSEPVAVLKETKGEVSFTEKASNRFVKAETGKNIFDGGAVKTTSEASVELEFIKDKTNVKVGENTYFEVKNFSKKELKQMGGVAIYNISPQDKELTVETPNGMATVLGTVFRIDVAATYTQLIVERGKVQFAKGDKKVVVEAGKYYSTAQKGDPKAEVFDPFELEKLFSGTSLKQGYNLR